MDFLELIVKEVVPETKEAKSYVLEQVNGNPITYEAGQFLTLLIEFNGHEVRRSYSMGSSPGTDDRLFITVKRKENGEISRHILEHWQPGTKVLAVPPSGRFTIETDPAEQRHLFFLAAGSGIVPVFSLIKSVLVSEPKTHITMLYQNHDETTIIYHRELQLLEEQYPQQFTRIDLLSHPLLHELPSRRLNNGLLEQLVGYHEPKPFRHHQNRPPTLFYTCGPPAFMRMVQFTLRVMGYEEDQIFKEHFTIPVLPPPALVIDPGPKKVLLKYQGKDYEFDVSYPTSILQAALNLQIELPYSCKAGRCATCTARCVSGEVKMTNNEVLTDKDTGKGLILTCVGYAATDVQLEFGGL
ncbi:ferredoxin--NADP reductase [Pseudobacter ginsenosidimutans]|uniref:Ring-1,2-phenylacetyl-CoA epoxidase subunit PaaE n=1 Tax=Pseudobacter ginsenosidimutans TaxID=661488 RepID=A0A4Q7N3R0_9BACT|nr:ferredoxin--NADP reductase [Pseudobacter ginsenosidimutans]QEC44165.1 ferredoxin--NADP reductase [Pseudobacter ginsenosidimutans]RZS75616.1 ring-1,2-phenylacetyl-CoA epoxidase subunit PaaE [Pseudobacter ginsenosidimutans]